MAAAGQDGCYGGVQVRWALRTIAFQEFLRRPIETNNCKQNKLGIVGARRCATVVFDVDVDGDVTRPCTVVSRRCVLHSPVRVKVAVKVARFSGRWPQDLRVNRLPQAIQQRNPTRAQDLYLQSPDKSQAGPQTL